MPLTFPNVMDPGVTPVSEAVLPAEPAQSAASEAGEKLKPDDEGEGAAVGAAAAPGVAPGLAVAAPVATRDPPVDDPVPDADDTAPPAAAVVVVATGPEACREPASPFAAAPRYGLTRAPHDAARNVTASRPASTAGFLPTTFSPPASRNPH
jgi:hypothetical protein